MKKTAIAMLTLAAGIMAASCQKEAEPEIKSFEPMTINAVSEGIGTATKTEMIYKYDIAWSANDKIYVTDGSVNDTFTLSDGEGTTKGTFTQDGTASFTSEVQAYYPATMVQNGGLVWPAAQTNNQTVPMYSTKTVSGNVEDFNFTSLGSVLQIVFNTAQENVTLKSIEIKDGSATLSGAFTVDADGKANITASDKAGITLDLGTGVALGKAANYFNIAVPSGNYQDLTLVFTATDGTKCTMTGGKVNIAYNAVGRLTLMGEKFKSDVPKGALEGEFSVSATRKVHFSQGNLFWDGDSFEFEANQYDSQNSWSANHVSYFFWSKTASIAYAENYSESGASTTDVFFSNETTETAKADFTVNGVTGKYRTLSSEEWQYLFNKHSKKWATVNGVGGYVIAPDNVTLQAEKTSYTATELNDANLVFLPAAGYRSGSDVSNVGNFGLYWSSTATVSGSAYFVHISSGLVYPDLGGNRFSGCSVRLITESK